MASRKTKGERNCQQCWNSCQVEYGDTVCRLGEVLLAFTSGFLTLVNFGTPYWLQKDYDIRQGEADSFHYGLWQNCTRSAGCKTIPLNGEAFLVAARVFMCMALVAGVLAWGIGVIALLQHRARWLFGSAGCYGVHAFLLLIGLAVFSKAYHEDGAKSSWSYTVGWVALILSIVCSVYFTLVATYGLWYHGNQSPRAKGLGQQQTYTPLAQIEESSETDDGDNDNL